MRVCRDVFSWYQSFQVVVGLYWKVEPSEELSFVEQCDLSDLRNVLPDPAARVCRPLSSAATWRRETRLCDQISTIKKSA
jgi:hypothetical protein